MNPTPDRLAGLRDIQLPDPVGLWPPAPGWWIAAAAFTAVGVAAWWYARQRRLGVRHVALSELSEFATRFRARPDHAALACALSGLLRRVALVRFRAREVASLHGAGWVAFLAEHGGGAALPPSVGTALGSAVYAGPRFEAGPEDGESWIAATSRWIEANT